MTGLIPDSWDTLSYTAGDVYDLDAHRALQDYARGGPRPAWENPGRADVVDFGSARSRLRPHAEPEWEEFHPVPRPTEEPESYEEWLARQPAGDLMSVDSQRALENEGFFEHEPGVWHRHVTSESGEPLAGTHILTYNPGERRPSDDERVPWVFTTDPESAGIAFSSLHGPEGALAYANEDRDQIRRMSNWEVRQ